MPVVSKSAGDLPVGTPGNDTLVKFLRLWGEPIVWRVIGKNLDGMPDGSITLLTDRIIAVLPFDAKEPNNSFTYQSNYEYRKIYGNNDYTVSNIRQWLNSTGSAGNWYRAQHSADQAPDKDNVRGGSNAYNTWAGFLYNQPSAERNLLITTKRIIGGIPGNGTTCNDKVFLLTTNELGQETRPDNGTKIPYFTNGLAHAAQSTEQCMAHNDYPSSGKPSSADTTWRYWLATGYSSNSSTDASNVCDDGGGASRVSTQYAFDGCVGVRPACNISADVKLSAEPDADGCYVVLT